MDPGSAAQDGSVIIIEELVKQFDDATAVNGLNLAILAAISLVVLAGIQILKRTA